MRRAFEDATNTMKLTFTFTESADSKSLSQDAPLAPCWFYQPRSRIRIQFSIGSLLKIIAVDRSGQHRGHLIAPEFQC